MNILFYGYIEQDNPVAEFTHINEVLLGLAKMGHNILSLNADSASEDMKSAARPRRPSLWQRVRGSISNSKLLNHIVGEFSIVWHLLLEVSVFFSAVKVLSRQAKKIDVIYRRHGLYCSEYRLARLFKIPLVKEVNGIVVDEIRMTTQADKFSLWLINRIERYNMSKADSIIVVTSKLKELLTSEYGIKPSRITVIQNGANTDLFRPMDGAILRTELGLPENGQYICFVGTLKRWQGVDCLIKCMPLVLAKYPEAFLLVVGGGPVKQELMALAEQTGVSGRVIFAGTVPYPKVPLYMNAADICTSPKAELRSGYSPLKLYEYMACGKPVVASRVSGFEVVENSGGGILAEAKDPQAFAAAIIQLLGDKELRAQMGARGRQYVVENHSWSSVARRVADVCQGAISSKDRGAP